MTQAELLYGLKKLPETNRLHLAVRQFLKIVQCPGPQEGLGIGEMDMMIAAHSLSTGAILVTNNTRHFDRPGRALFKVTAVVWTLQIGLTLCRLLGLDEGETRVLRFYYLFLYNRNVCLEFLFPHPKAN